MYVLNVENKLSNQNPTLVSVRIRGNTGGLQSISQKINNIIEFNNQTWDNGGTKNNSDLKSAGFCAKHR